LDFGGYACDIISRVAIGYYEPKIIYFSNYLKLRFKLIQDGGQQIILSQNISINYKE
jgi:hypothetical protein